jgi:hypothetical protein
LDPIHKYVNTGRLVDCRFAVNTRSLPKLSESAKPGDREFDEAVQRVVKKIEGPASACIERIKALDRDDEAYRKVVASPLLHGNRLAGPFNLSRVGANLRQVLGSAERVGTAATGGAGGEDEKGMMQREMKRAYKEEAARKQAVRVREGEKAPDVIGPLKWTPTRFFKAFTEHKG